MNDAIDIIKLEKKIKALLSNCHHKCCKGVILTEPLAVILAVVIACVVWGIGSSVENTHQQSRRINNLEYSVHKLCIGAKSVHCYLYE